MTPSEIQALLHNSAGKRITLESHELILAGTIVGFDGQHLQVRGVRTTYKLVNKPPSQSPASFVEKWGVPMQEITPQREGDVTVLAWREEIFGEWRTYKLTLES